MTTSIVNKDIEILAVKANKGGTTFYQKTTNKQSTYSIEDIIVDPMGRVGIGPDKDHPYAAWARDGFYGFRLPKNKRGYEMMLVHDRDLIVK